MEVGIIYRCNIGNKFYIGQTIKTLEQRQKEHLRDCLNPNHVQYNTKFYKKLRDNPDMIWEIIEEVNIDKLSHREIYWIDIHDSYRNGYNSTLGGDGSRGFKHREEFKQNLSERMKSNNPMKGKFGTAHNRFGSKHTEQWKQNQSRRMSENNPNKGKSLTHPRAKLNFEIAKTIRECFYNGTKAIELANEYKVSLTTIRRILRKEIWSLYE